MNTANPITVNTSKLLAAADQCVACGLCVPHCPTYRKTGSEADSPRGRIALMDGVLKERIPLNQRFVEHIDLCLTCRACEAVCPNHVPYGELVNGMRERIAAQRPARQRWAQRIGLALLTEPALAYALANTLRVYQRSGMQSLLRNVGLLRLFKLERLESQLPPMPSSISWRSIYPANGELRGEVALFLGCVARALDTETLQSIIFTLNQLGFTVHVPFGQACCGALHAHAGDQLEATRFAKKNIDAFAQHSFDAIITTASGCGAQLMEYGRQAHSGNSFSAKIVDISQFLEKHGQWDRLTLPPLQSRVAVQDACTLRNVMKVQHAPYNLLKRIPQLEVIPLPGNDQCCGAAGTYFLSQPKMAQQLADDKALALKALEVEYLASSNIGCRLHLQHAIAEAGLKIKVVHPITILAQQLKTAGS